MPMSIREVVERAEEVARDVLAPQAEKVDREARWPEEGMRALQDAGLGGLVVPERYGGLGHGLSGLAHVCEVLAQRCASTAISYGMHCVGAAVLTAQPTDEQVERFVVPVAQGRHLTTLALSEPGTGAHFYLPQALLEQTSDGYVVNGTKTFVTNGSHADSYVVSVASTSDQAGDSSFSCIVVPADKPGLAWGDAWSGLGMRGNDARTVRLEGVPIEPDLLLGKQGDEMWYVLNVVAPYFLTAMSGTYLGIAAAALDEAIAHVTSRRHAHSGSALADADVVQHRVGSLHGVLLRTRALLHQGAAGGDTGSADAPLMLFAAKAEVADAAERITSESMTLMGGIAYREHSTMHRHLRDARAAHVMAPTTDMLRLWAGRWLLDRPIFAD